MRTWVAAAVCLMVVGSGCTDEGSQAGASAARTELRASVDKTLKADSFHVEARGDVEQDVAEEGEGFRPSLLSMDYNAPDRVHTRMVTPGAAGPAFDVIDIGSTSYFGIGDPEGKRRYEKRSAPEGQSPPAAARVLTPLRMARSAKTVTRDGDIFVAVPGPGIRLRVRVEGGYVVRLVMQTEPQTADGTGTDSTARMTQEFTYSKFGSAERVEAPPAEQIVDGGSESTSPTSGGSSERVDLPPPTPGRRSTLQLRGVNGLAESGCAGVTANPPAGDPAKLVYDEDTCYDLAPSSVELRTVEDFDVERDAGGRFNVNLSLDEADAEAFDRMAETYFQRQVAIVAFGRVLAAPTVQQREFRGEITVSGLTAQDAADLKASLAGS